MILVTGATGNVGREVVNLLLASGEKVVAVTRHPATAVLPEGTHVVGGDPTRPHTLVEVLRGIETIFISPRALGDATAGAATAELLKLAAEQGVQRVVALSAVTVEYGGGYQRFADAFRAVEDAVRASGLQWTILRCADFASNALAWAPQIRHASVVRGVYGDGATATIHERDIAAVSARVLVNAEYAGRSYALTGPQSLTQRAKLHIISEAIGKDVPWVEVAPEQFRQAMLAQGLPEDVPDRVIGYWVDRVQQPGPSTDTVEQILGRPALTFAQWAAEHAVAFRS
ncbi:nucleotide-diphosphate-sugar epimerase [Reticulibacter mediterranei]|uniref:Nucleotide-diphosphate-sugar epimerase n=1 Tax=Reticulibacter mediterranei TaxID=2778369 RepID=A0A8J3MZL5_9CHLR|nr:NAD(P)H-binding protein [Reticulibacter mediterranei]GHO92032.1 nucleotide-diphosphate-sugar epimerase [Reticulibacter mediterranei]